MCTANQCRSPMAEALFRRRLDERRVAAVVRSAGFLEGGAPATEQAVDAMAAEGLDISGHLSQAVTIDLVRQADLVITMTRQHLIELTVMVPDAWPRMFQAVDLVRRAEKVGPRPPGRSFAEWLAAVGEGRTRAGILGASLSDDVADPVGLSAAVYERTKTRLDDLLTRLAALV
jgi:protein-tyrosine-phosphatase